MLASAWYLRGQIKVCSSKLRRINSEFKCRGLVGIECDEESLCVPGAECLKNSVLEGGSRCSYSKGCVQGEDFARYLAHWETCKSDVADRHEKCDPVAKLLCEEGQCRCENRYDKYVPQTRKFAAPFWFPCRTDHDCVTGANCNFHPESGTWIFKNK